MNKAFSRSFKKNMIIKQDCILLRLMSIYNKSDVFPIKHDFELNYTSDCTSSLLNAESKITCQI